MFWTVYGLHLFLSVNEKVFILVGEASGDLHASNLVKEMNMLQPDLKWKGWGGDLLQKQGVQLSNHIRNLSFMGFRGDSKYPYHS